MHTALEAAQAAAASAKTTFHILATAAESMIPMLPAEQQATKRKELSELVVRGDQVFRAEEDAIAAAMAANAETFDASKFAAAIAAVLDDLIALSTKLNVRRDLIDDGTARSLMLKATR